MNSQDYAVAAMKTEAPVTELKFSRSGLAQVLAFAALSGDLIDLAKKTMIYGKPLDKDAFSDKMNEIFNRLTAMTGMLHRIDTPDAGPFLTALHEPNLRLLHGVIGMFGESAEMAEALLKGMQTGNLDMVNLAEETGDSDWYKVLIHDETGQSEEAMRALNIAKLMKRYPGKFVAAAALNRDLAAERAALEGAAA